MDPESCTDPLQLFEHWYRQAEGSGAPLVNAMTLATVGQDGRPHARTVLFKGLVEQGLSFYTCYDSKKAHELTANPWAALVFHFAEIKKQIRIEGTASRLSAKASDLYFSTRPRQSQLSAWASPQSRIIDSRDWLERRYLQVEASFVDKPVTRPPNWGGLSVWPSRIEFWQGRSGRLHDRWLFTRDEKGWSRVRLAP